jgi:hypothetical protein
MNFFSSSIAKAELYELVEDMERKLQRAFTAETQRRKEGAKDYEMVLRDEGCAWA